MAGDQLKAEPSRAFYSKWIKGFVPAQLAAALRDMVEIYLDRKLYDALEQDISRAQPEIILQKHTRYGQAGVRLARKLGIPIFLDDITPVWEGEVYNDRSLKPIARLIRKRVFSQASGLIAVSPEMVKQLRAEGIPEHKIIFVPNGVDCRLFDPDATPNGLRQELGLSGKIVAGYVGLLAEYHKIDLLIKAACRVVKSVPDIHFLLVGNLRNGKFKEMAEAHGIADRFTFTGVVQHEQVPAYIKAMDFCLIPATLAYMSPMKIYEYMSMQKPVIAPLGNTISEMMVHSGKEGLLFSADDEAALADAIILLAQNPEYTRELGIEARKRIQNQYTWYHQTKELVKAFDAARASRRLLRTALIAGD